MASHRFSLTTLGDMCAPCYRVGLVSDRCRFQQYRLEEGRAAIIQLIRPPGGALIDPTLPERNFLSVELIYEFRLTRAQPLAVLNTMDTGLSVLLIGLSGFYVSLFGTKGTVITGRLETN